MNYAVLFISLLPLVSSAGNRLDNRTKVEDFVNVCMLGNNHKAKPSPEPSLYQSCNRWSDNACCHQNTTTALHTKDTWFNFDWNHCSRKLSDKCRQHFVDDLCFYECSPNVGPWLVSETRTWRRERFVQVPMCESACNAWWEDCKTELTCRDNWYTGFDWSTGTNKCKADEACFTFHQIFGNAKKFCENIWDGSWKVIPDSDQCMHISWTDGANPNDAVAAARAKEIVEAISGGACVRSWVLASVLAVVCSLWI